MIYQLTRHQFAGASNKEIISEKASRKQLRKRTIIGTINIKKSYAPVICRCPRVALMQREREEKFQTDAPFHFCLDAKRCRRR